MDRCPPPDSLRDLLAGEPSGPEADRAEAHLRGCAHCQALLETLSDDPELSRWAAVLRAAREEAGGAVDLGRLLDRLRGRPSLRPPETAAPARWPAGSRSWARPAGRGTSARWAATRSSRSWAAAAWGSCSWAWTRSSSAPWR
jgi:hypothetical protein